MIGIIYKLYCDGIDGFYIGSCLNIKKRKSQHKSNCNNDKCKEYNYKVYQYIRENGGWDNWKFEILETALFENKTALRIREQHYKNLLNPSLNSLNAYQSQEERRLYNIERAKIPNKKRLTTKNECACGSTTSQHNKARHEKTNRHQKYITNNITNNTYNITINN